MQNGTTPSLKKAGDIKVLSKIALSRGLFFIMLAPFIWGFLPLAYKALNKTAEIKANPLFTVFMRMSFSAAITLLVIIVLALIVMYSTCSNGKKAVRLLFCGEQGIVPQIKANVKWLGLLALFYFGARWIEMEQFLTYSLSNETIVIDNVTTNIADVAFLEGVNSRRAVNTYLGEQIDSASRDVRVEMAPTAYRTASALGDYGYFMGLILALLLAVKNNFVYKWVSKIGLFSQSRILVAGKLSFSGKIFWFSTAFLILASGILYVSAIEPLYVWPYIFKMTIVALAVALLTSLGTDAKILGNIKVGSVDGVKWWIPPLFGSLVVNFFQSTGTATLAWIVWRLRGHSISCVDLAGKYFAGGNWLVLIFGVCIACTVVAPVLLLLGKNLHDSKMDEIKMGKYAVTGNDWLVISGGFEPLFVVLIGFMIGFMPNAESDPMISKIMMLVAVAAVIVVAFLKIAEVWAEKSSRIKNKIFADVRGSTQDDQSNKSLEELEMRAKKLSVLKFYDKRNELLNFNLSVKAASSAVIPSFALPANAILVFIENGQKYFTQDDPFTNTVLRAHEQYLEHKFANVTLISLKRLVKCAGVDSKTWKEHIREEAQAIADSLGIDGANSMPYVIIGGIGFEAVVGEWRVLLEWLGNVTMSGEIDEYLNGMIVEMEGE